MRNKIEIENVSYIYSQGTPFRTEALKDVSCSFKEGIITGLIGHTGSGKSTLVQLLNGLLKPTAGRVLLDGKDIWENPKKINEIRFRVGLVFQYPEYQLFEESVYADIAYGPKNIGLNKDEIDKRVRQSAQFVGIDEGFFEKSPFDLSGGQMRRVAIAGIFALMPEVLVLDEPAAGLDPMGRDAVFNAVTAYQRTTGATVIIVSHSMEDMAKYADRIMVMSNAKVVLEGEPSEIYKNAKTLCSIGLDVPQITRLMMKLSDMGVPNRTDIFTVEGARDEILRLLGKGGNVND